MKTVGQIIRRARVQRGLSLDQLSHLTKIDTRYIEALELDNYSILPSETFAKGFIRNLSQRLDLDPAELVAIFRRDYRLPDSGSTTKPHRRLVLPENTNQYLPFILGALVFLVYLFFQFRAIITPPKLTLVRPYPDAVLVSPVEIEGDTVVDATVFINEETKLRPDSTGHFLARVNLPIGETIIEVKTVNRFGRTTSKKVPVTIISK